MGPVTRSKPQRLERIFIEQKHEARRFCHGDLLLSRGDLQVTSSHLQVPSTAVATPLGDVKVRTGHSRVPGVKLRLLNGDTDVDGKGVVSPARGVVEERRGVAGDKSNCGRTDALRESDRARLGVLLLWVKLPRDACAPSDGLSRYLRAPSARELQW